LKSDYAEAMLNLSTVLDYMSNLDAAIYSLKNVLQIDADNHGLKAKVCLAIFRFLEGDFAKSRKYLLEASKNSQTNFSLQSMVISIYLQYIF
jgi:hypothetical protein